MLAETNVLTKKLNFEGATVIFYPVLCNYDIEKPCSPHPKINELFCTVVNKIRELNGNSDYYIYNQPIISANVYVLEERDPQLNNFKKWAHDFVVAVSLRRPEDIKEGDGISVHDLNASQKLIEQIYKKVIENRAWHKQLNQF